MKRRGIEFRALSKSLFVCLFVCSCPSKLAAVRWATRGRRTEANTHTHTQKERERERDAREPERSEGGDGSPPGLQVGAHCIHTSRTLVLDTLAAAAEPKWTAGERTEVPSEGLRVCR